MNKATRFIISGIVVVIALTWLFGYSIPNIQRANEEVRLAQIEYDQSQAELDDAMDELNHSVNEILNES